MKIVVTGSLGHISKPLAEQLLTQGHSVTVISSQPARKSDIEALGASAAIGTIEDVSFLASAFRGADAVYCMEPPVNFFDHSLDFMTYYRTVGENYVEAIRRAAVPQVVHLSSIGAHMAKGNGLLAFHYEVEKLFNELPSGVGLTILRPVGFYYNLLGFIHTIKSQGAIITNYGSIREPWVATQDIADVVAEEIGKPFTGRKIRYIASDELHCDEVAATLGTAIGKPGLKWTVIPDEAQERNLVSAGMSPVIAKAMVEMNASRHSGLYEDYYRNRPVLGKTKLTDFAATFSTAYHKGN